MSYLQITNEGACDPVGFVTLGVSTSRDKKESIGQFGSGSKLSALVLLRNGINPIIYCGDTKIKFFTKTATMKHSDGEKEFEQVYINIGGTVERLSMSLDFGALDWIDVNYGVREYVSNALDQSNQDISKIDIKIVDMIVPHPDKTIVGIPLTDQIQLYYEKLEQHFLHFSSHFSHKDKILPKTKIGPAKIYRKGVYVKSIQSKLPSIFNYNFDDELKIDESRSLDTYNCQIEVTQLLSTSEKIGDVFEALVLGTQCWETKFSNWQLESVAKYDSDIQKLWQKQWKKRFGDSVIAMDEQGPLIQSARQKGYTVKVIEFLDWYVSMVNAGVPSIITVLDDVNEKGHTILSPTDIVMETLDKVWSWIEKVRLTNDKPKPSVKCFRTIQNDESLIMGYCKDNIVYINEDCTNSKQTMIEELSHYITEASDNTSVFQTFAFQLSVAFAKELEQTQKALRAQWQLSTCK